MFVSVALGQTLTLEVPERVRGGEPVSLRVLRDGEPVAGSDIRVVGPAVETGAVKAKLALWGTLFSIYQGERLPIVASGGGECDVLTQAGARRTVRCDSLDRQPFGQPLGRTGADGTLTVEDLTLVPMKLELSALSGADTSPPATLEVVFPEVDTREGVAPGIELITRHWVHEEDGPFLMHVLEVDPHSPAVNILPVRAHDLPVSREKTSSMAARYGAVAAINGSFFDSNGASRGIYVWNEQLIAGGKGKPAILWCTEENYVERAIIDVVDADPALRKPPTPHNKDAYAACRPTEIIGAGPWLGPDQHYRPAERHPRTAFALTSRGTMLFATVDGRQPRSAGMTLEELAEALRDLGATDAINLDGGGSTTMVLHDEVINFPSDGEERAVSDAILIFSVATQEDLSRLLESLAKNSKFISPGLHARLQQALADEDMDKFRRILLEAETGQLSWQARRLLEEAAALLQ